MNTQDEVLLKLHRQYGKDESFKVLFNEISKLNVRIGELISETEELKFENKNLQAKLNITKDSLKEIKKDEYVKQLKNNHLEKVTKLNKEIKEWHRKYFDLLLKYNQSRPSE